MYLCVCVCVNVRMFSPRTCSILLERSSFHLFPVRAFFQHSEKIIKKNKQKRKTYVVELESVYCYHYWKKLEYKNKREIHIIKTKEKKNKKNFENIVLV